MVKTTNQITIITITITRITMGYNYHLKPGRVIPLMSRVYMWDVIALV